MLNIKSIEDQFEFRQAIPNAMDNFIDLLESRNLEAKSDSNASGKGEFSESDGMVKLEVKLQ